MKVIKVEDCSLCPYYERLEGREHIYHTCKHANTVLKDGHYMSLFRHCKLPNIE